MNILIKELESFVTKNNKKIVQRLISVLMENNIDTYSELEDLENNYFDSEMSLLDRIELSYEQMIKDIYKFDNMTIEEINSLDEMKEMFNNDVENKLILIIKMYHLLNYQMIFPFCCYKLICEGKI